MVYQLLHEITILVARLVLDRIFKKTWSQRNYLCKPARQLFDWQRIAMAKLSSRIVVNLKVLRVNKLVHNLTHPKLLFNEVVDNIL